MIAKAPASSPCLPFKLASLTSSSPPRLSGPRFLFSISKGQREKKGRNQQQLKQQLHLWTRRHYNGVATALPRQHAGRGMVTPRQKWEKEEGRVGGNKEKKNERWRLLSGVYLPGALVAVWQKCLVVSSLILGVTQWLDVFIVRGDVG